ncbi:extracellular solute-binding protein [Paenibacillus whitsoniae]|uniref:Extracellular solute-binding protein n=1 Tax=Paenibacillus whitsoniae TaxID=2496558 RepID=A0A430JB81_9BACL|nr:extracellular solute-binding protein [Paenibacillus whitsoniae]RTE08255.1 extracellular solute-binding protein [Paenibacillus whitsoniae]
MQKYKKIAASATSIALIGSLLAACGNATNNTGSSAAPGASAESSKMVKLNIIESGSGLPAPEKDFVRENLNKALNADINLTAYATDYGSQLNVRMAAGDYPDLFGVDKASLKQLSDQGLLLDLTPYFDKELKPVKTFIGDSSLKKGTVNGKIFAVAQAPQAPKATYWIRKDWLDKLQLKTPETLDDLLTVSKAFTEKDPDGNGKNDTYGLTGLMGATGLSLFSAFSPVFGGYGVPNPGEFFVKDGKVVQSLYDPGMKDALTFISKFVASGSVDPDYILNTGTQPRDKAIKGQVGIIWTEWTNLTNAQYVEQIKKVNPNAEWVQLPAPKGPAGQFSGSTDIGKTAGLMAIPKSLEKDKTKLHRVFDLLNYISTGEGSRLVQYGVAGKHYNLENGKVIPTPLMASEAGYTYLYQFTGRPDLEYLSTKFATQFPYIDFANKQSRIQSLNGFLNYPDGYSDSDAGRYISEELTKFIYGKRPLSQYDDFLKSLETTMNYKTFLNSANKQLNDLGYGK